jgi:hypothetical protein
MKLVDLLYLTDAGASITVPYLDPLTSEELVLRHPLNNRYEEVTMRAYESRITDRGVMQEYRGRPATQKTQLNGYTKRLLLTNATVSMTLLRCWRKYPENLTVQVAALVAYGGVVHACGMLMLYER